MKLWCLCDWNMTPYMYAQIPAKVGRCPESPGSVIQDYK